MQTLNTSDGLPSTLLIATGNPGKIAEIRGLLSGIPILLESLADHSFVTEVEETGATFTANATLKAVGYAQQTGRWCLADDSGLEVTALGGRPGVHSARYGGPGMNFPEKMDLLLGELAAAADPDRSARFVCSMIVADENGRVMHSVEAECRGRIASEASGGGGFGFDPIFIPEGFDRTFGELPGSVKARISHRARAAKEITRYLLDFIGVST